jgi:hypothetical protein
MAEQRNPGVPIFEVRWVNENDITIFRRQDSDNYHQMQTVEEKSPPRMRMPVKKSDIKTAVTTVDTETRRLQVNRPRE